jgi:cytochrome c oxidase subunit 4
MSEVIVPKKTYLLVWGSLLTLLALSVAVAYVHLGWFNFAAAFGIAAVKALIIILFFMHARYSPKVVWLVVMAGFVWLGMLFLWALTDYLTRAYMPPPTVWS